MKTLVRQLAAALVLLSALVAVQATPAGAELADANTVSWGVTGLATGTETDSIQSNVFAIEQIGNRVYVGGRFLQATNGQSTVSQPFLAAFDATTGVFDPTFTPVLDKPVYALDRSDDGTTLFVGGEFNTVNGTTSRALAAIDPTTGALKTTWSGRVTGSALVRGLDVRNGKVYASGRFTGVASANGSVAASNVARFDVVTGAHDATWLPQVSGGTVWAVTASPSADRVYLAGYFTQVNGTARAGGFAALLASSSANAPGVDDFKINTATVSRQYAYDVEVANGNVFVGGSEHFVQVLRESDLHLQKFHLTDPNGDFQDLEVVGDRVYAGCHCRKTSTWAVSSDRLWFRMKPPAGQSNGPVLAQGAGNWVFAFDGATGDRVTSFDPALTSGNAGIWAIHGSPDGCLWLGGQITGDGSRSANNLLRLCSAPSDAQRPSTPQALAATGTGPGTAALTWSPSTDNVGVAGYYVYNNADNSIVATVTTASASLSGLAGGPYTFAVKAFDAAGNISWRSNLASVTVEAPPTNPLGCTIWGTEGNDTINGTSGDDVICALGGDDIIRSGNGNDIIYAGAGNDDVDGGGGNDLVYGNEGNDIVRGGADNDTVEGNEGDDTVTGWNGDDILRGGIGNDKLIGGAGVDSFDGGDGTDTCTGAGSFANCEL